MAIVAELAGKLEGYRTGAGIRYADAEDPLTASIFESIEVMDRDVALGAILRQATGDVLSSEELAQAEFHYWLRDVEAFGDRTEPDLIITVGDTVYLLEAKYRSGLGQETRKSKGQLKREFDGGMALADKWGLSRFRMVCVVGDMSTSDEVLQFAEGTGCPVHRLQWQDIHRLMTDILQRGGLDPRDRILATRCRGLLEGRRMATFQGFPHLQAYKDAQAFYDEVFSFATMLLHRLEPHGILQAAHEFRIERDGGQRSLKLRMLDEWGASYFALPVQKQADRAAEKRPAGTRRVTVCRVDRFAFFMLDTDTTKLMVGRATAPSGTWVESTFWNIFFRTLKKSRERQETTTLTVRDTTFRLDVVLLNADRTDLLEETSRRLVEYLS